MQDYKPNSHRFREQQAKEFVNQKEEKQIRRVVKGETKTRKKSTARKMADVFISEDISSVKQYVFMDVLVPAVKKALFDIIKDGADMLLYGGTGQSSRSSSGSKISYSSYYSKPGGERRSYERDHNFAFDDILYDNRGEAESVLQEMRATIERYGMVSVGDMYDMSNLKPPYTSQDYGWTSLRTAEVVRTRDGYVIKLPKMSTLN